MYSVISTIIYVLSTLSNTNFIVTMHTDRLVFDIEWWGRRAIRSFAIFERVPYGGWGKFLRIPSSGTIFDIPRSELSNTDFIVTMHTDWLVFDIEHRGRKQTCIISIVKEFPVGGEVSLCWIPSSVLSLTFFRRSLTPISLLPCTQIESYLM